MKGVLFSYIILFVVLTLVGLISIQKGMISYYGEKISIETRVDSMNSFYESIIVDCGKALDIISKRAISATISHVAMEGKSLEQANSTLAELALNGTYNGTQEPLMASTILSYWVGKTEDVGKLNGFDTGIVIGDLKIMPYDSWNLLVSVEISINITDQRGVASLNRTVEVDQLTSIEGFEDPIYSLNTLGRVTNIIIRSPYWGNFTQFNGTSWDIDNLKKDIDNSYYSPSVKGASFLDRLEGKLEVQDKYKPQTSSVIGLESFVNKETLINFGIAVDMEKTNIDHLYFSANSHQGRKVLGLESTSFRIDTELCGSQSHADVYGVSSLII